VEAASGEATMARALGRKGKRGGGALEVCGGGRGGGGSGPLYRRHEWGARAQPVMVVASETMPLIDQS
jgi:hypothetical protein